MNGDFLYRFNYGPITEEEIIKVTTFLRNQYRDVEAIQKAKTLASVYRFSWRKYFPFFLSPIRRAIETPEWLAARAEHWNRKKQSMEPTLIGCIDPVLFKMLLWRIYPKRPQSSETSCRGYTAFTYHTWFACV